MSATRVSKKLADRVKARASQRCEYCLTPDLLTGQEGEIDHIEPQARGGTTHYDNLCLACAPCNGFKLDRTAAVDAETGLTVPLFNPRTQRWHEHFMWSDDGTRIIGVTPCGRATVSVLKMNRPLVTAARALWVSTGLYPPDD
jgi:hypothetical protein